MAIQFQRKICLARPYLPETSSIEAESETAISRFFESDRGRIIYSAAIRRLQQKTQVFPLERNASVRSRLTHSLEVQQAGRYIAREVLEQLRAQKKLAAYGLDRRESAFISIVEMGCLLHDVGNPPFGHFGEEAIKDWFKENLSEQLIPLPQQAEHLALSKLQQLNQQIRQDLCNFEGNAQAIRLVHTLLQLNLSYSQVACILKYTRPAWHLDDDPKEFSVLMKKPGYYLSEQEYIQNLQRATDLAPYHRYPLTYIMEAADDIAYCIADLDDAVEKDIFDVETLYQHLQKEWQTVKDDDLFSKTVQKARDEAQQAEWRHCSPRDQFFMTLRVEVQKHLVKYAVSRFLDNIKTIFAGSFNAALLESDGDHGRLINMFKQIATRYVFRDSEVEQLELQGYRVIQGLLDAYKPMLALSGEKFQHLVDNDHLPKEPIVTRLYHRLSEKHCQAYKKHLKELSHQAKSQTELELWERYYRCRLIQDYISGMTDIFAWEEYRRLMAVDFV